MEYTEIKNNIDESDFYYPNLNNITFEKSLKNNNLNNDQDNMKLLIESILSNNQNVENFYNILMLQAITKQDKKILQEIMYDNLKHIKMLKNIYATLFKTSRFANTLYTLDTPDTSYATNLDVALNSILSDIDTYMKLYENISKDHAMAIHTILIDKLKNANKINLLILRNKI